ncbi:MAG TPA: TIGR00269 family protein [Candidatus Nanoarchaeia archaeon]|nr:TIGR00269 family protein [Candidatus Nanoarchaeia archaeon]
MKIQEKVKETLKKAGIEDKKEKIIVALSGGKDSTVTAYILKKLGYNIEGLHINLGVGKYSDDCLRLVKKLCNELNIKLHIYDLKKEQGKSMHFFWDKIKKEKKLTTCSICGVFKKWILNKKARDLEGDKIATGHNLDDEAQTVLINFFKGSLSLSEKSGVITKEIQDENSDIFIPRIKPLFNIAEKDILKFAKEKKMQFLTGSCPYAEESYRIQVRRFLSKIKTKEKENILKNFKEMQKTNKKENKKEINFCENCGEPSKGELCKRCELLKLSKKQ